MSNYDDFAKFIAVSNEGLRYNQVVSDINMMIKYGNANDMANVIRYSLYAIRDMPDQQYADKMIDIFIEDFVGGEDDD